MNSVQPLHRFPLLRTNDFDEMRTALARIYTRPRMEFVGSDRTLHAAINLHRLPNIELIFASYAANLMMEFPETNFVSQLVPIRGEGEVRIKNRSFSISSSRSLVISANDAFTMANDCTYERLVLRMRAGILKSKLAALTGDSISRPLVFHPVQDFAQPAAKMLRSNFLFLVANTSASTEQMPRFVLLEFEQALITMFLYANRNSYSDRLEGDAAEAAPDQLRRAEEFIEASWALPVTLEEIVEACGANIRSLSRIFRRRRGCSPIEFLRQVRLRRARELLQWPDEATTLYEVATTCGFVDVDVFAKAYRQIFGEEPGDTLTRSRRPRLH